MIDLDDYNYNKRVIIADSKTVTYDDFLGKDLNSVIMFLEELNPNIEDSISEYFRAEYSDEYDYYGDPCGERIYEITFITERYETEDEFKERRKKEKKEEKELEKRLKDMQSQKDVERLRKLREEQTEEIFKGVNVLTTEELMKLYDIVDKKLKYVGV